MFSKRASYALALLVALSACGDSGGSAPQDAGAELAASDQQTPPQRCPRGQVRAAPGATCGPFSTTDIVDEEVSFQNGKQKLSGTVTKPKTTLMERFPAVVLLHGSGPNDRDETSTGALGFGFGKEVKPFKDIAEHLAKNGYLVLRYDKRTCTNYNSKSCKATSIEGMDTISIETFIDDASKALDYLKTRDDVRTEDLILVGHSQGGPMVLALGKRRQDVQSVVVLAGAAFSLRETLLDQYKLLMSWMEADLPPGPDKDSKIAKVQKTHDTYDKALTEIEKGTYPSSTFEGSPVGFWKSWIDSHAAIEGDIRALSQPLAVLSGDEDYNIPPKHTKQLETWRGPKSGDLFVVYEGLTHAMIKFHKAANKVDDQVHGPLLQELTSWLHGAGPSGS